MYSRSQSINKIHTQNGIQQQHNQFRNGCSKLEPENRSDNPEIK